MVGTGSGDFAATAGTGALFSEVVIGQSICQPPFDAVPGKVERKRIMDISAAMNDSTLFPLNESDQEINFVGIL